jgi:hypothetical protein
LAEQPSNEANQARYENKGREQHESRNARKTLRLDPDAE